MHVLSTYLMEQNIIGTENLRFINTVNVEVKEGNKRILLYGWLATIDEGENLPFQSRQMIGMVSDWLQVTRILE